MRVPRRCRRRLLLPPGWVALGFLLLLGCQALQPWQGQLRFWNMLQVTMPARKPVAGMSWNDVVYRSPRQLNHFRAWHEVKLVGQALPDFFSLNELETATRAIQTDTSHVGGVRVRFGPGATYANLVQVLDCMLCTGQPKYWWDIRYRSTTFYAITVRPESRAMYRGGCIREPEVAINGPSFWSKLLSDFCSLWQPAWRWPLVLLIAITVLNFWHIAPSRRFS